MGNENQELEKKKKEQKPEIPLQQQNYEKRQMQGWMYIEVQQMLSLKILIL